MIVGPWRLRCNQNSPLPGWSLQSWNWMNKFLDLIMRSSAANSLSWSMKFILSSSLLRSAIFQPFLRPILNLVLISYEVKFNFMDYYSIGYSFCYASLPCTDYRSIHFALASRTHRFLMALCLIRISTKSTPLTYRSICFALPSRIYRFLMTLHLSGTSTKSQTRFVSILIY